MPPLRPLHGVFAASTTVTVIENNVRATMNAILRQPTVSILSVERKPLISLAVVLIIARALLPIGIGITKMPCHLIAVLVAVPITPTKTIEQGSNLLTTCARSFNR